MLRFFATHDKTFIVLSGPVYPDDIPHHPRHTARFPQMRNSEESSNHTHPLSDSTFELSRAAGTACKGLV
ncbi:hypothetical protein BDV09DRAFT_167408 [Aspergillus tetrazonus]